MASSRQCVLQSIAHQQPVRVPIDFGSSPTSGMHVSCVAELRRRLGLEKRLVKVHEPYQMLGWIDEDLKQALGIDVEGVPGRTTIFGFANENWKSWQAPWGQEMLVSEHFQTSLTAGGDVLIYPQGDRSAPPSGHMPKSGYFFDSIIRQQPIDEEHLNVEDNLEEFGPLTSADLAYLVTAVGQARQSGRAVLATLPGCGLGDIALVPAPFLKNPKGIRDVAQWYMATAVNREYVHEIFSRQVQIALANLEKINQAVGAGIDIAFVCGTDFGTQTSSFCSLETFQELYLPYYTQINSWIHKNTRWKTFKHSCGAVDKFIPAFIACGFDILNPVQCSATGMEPEHLKRAYGGKITYWGGGVDTQKVLPFGTPQEVRQQVTQRCRVFAPGGGFVFNSIHNVQALTPVENILAMFEAVRKYSANPAAV